ncbi:MAG: glycosyltransferase family 4 protein [Planctomycetes bacterium]|nr:glycosyltransferase family 4 protein [Planctomycetota bacterium]
MSSGLRIARIIARLNLGGPARQILASDPWLTARGHVVRVFAGSSEPGEGDLFETARERGIDVVRVPGLSRGVSLPMDLRARSFLRRALREFAPDVVHTHASKAGALGRRAAAVVPQAALVHTFHGHVLEGYFGATISKGLAALERRLATRTDRLIAVSHATADDLLRLGVARPGQLVVVPPGLDLEPLLEIPLAAPARRSHALRSLVGADPGDFLVGVVGRLAEVKRPEWALDVFQLLAARHPRLMLAFIGDGDLRGLMERRIQALEPSLARRVHLLGARTDMPAVLADLDAVLATSRSEGLPVALVEAGAAGLPVVATRVGGVEELVAEERTGFLGTSVDELAYGLSKLLADPALGSQFGQRARLRVEKRHSAPALGTQLERLYQAVVQERRAAP